MSVVFTYFVVYVVICFYVSM